MVIEAVQDLGAGKKGASYHVIKGYIVQKYALDKSTASRFIKKGVEAAVASNKIYQTTGKGANGSFKETKKNSAGRRVTKPQARSDRAKTTKQNKNKENSSPNAQKQ
jgi:hypothetical protein